jgi:acyl dehydratase
VTRGVVVGAHRGPFDGRIDAEYVRRYADATRDPSADVQAGLAVPPTALVTKIWDAQHEGRVAAIPQELWRSAAGGVHGEHDLLLHRSVTPGEPLAIWVEGYGARPAGRNCAVVLKYTTVDARGGVVAEQWWTTVFLGTTCDPAGRPAPGHAFPDGARSRPIGECAVAVDADMARRYAAVSGDWSDHHFDVDAARRSGADRVFLHGLCTMALCARAVAAVVAGGAPDRLRRLAVRFASPTYLGEDLNVRCYDAGEDGYAFEADCADSTVITHGRAELW